ncbi:MAG: hypothetical protein M3364_04730, partial [Actinomycetota bacterium]|nr:hypothetical protein [Actinomycetota bacterium]
LFDVTVLPRPGFPAPAGDVNPSGARLALVSTRYRSPATPPLPQPDPPPSTPKRFRGEDLQLAIRQPGGHVFLVYGDRYLVKATSQSYALDFVNFMRPPNGAWLEELTWARQVGRVLYVEHTHLTYASATRGRNAYISAIDLDAGKTLWRSPALVANARTFLVSGNLIVSGYGFTAEDDFLYLLDRRTGKVLDRLPVPSAPEVIKLRGDRLYVRTYDRQVVGRIVRGG